MAPTEAAAGARLTKLVCFRLAGQDYGAEITDVKESMAPRPITRVFLTPPWLAGIMNLRGDVVPVIDLGRFLGFPPAPPSDDSRIVLAQKDGHRAGLLVDALAELREVELGTLAPAPATLPPEVGRLLAGLATLADGTLIRVLDLGALFDHDRVRSLDGLRDG